MKGAIKYGAVTLVAGLVFFCAACSDASYSLSRDKSLTTDWGTIIQYKIDSNWEESNDLKSDEDTAYAEYSNKEKDVSVFVTAKNTDGKLYKYSSTSTYGDWLDWHEKIYTQSPADQAAEYKRTMGDSSYYNEKRAQADQWPEYSNYSMKELGTFEFNGNSFRLYEMKYTTTWSDARFAEIKETNPDAEQSSASDRFYGIIKDGNHDLEVSASSEKLLKDYLDTLEIKW